MGTNNLRLETDNLRLVQLDLSDTKAFCEGNGTMLFEYKEGLTSDNLVDDEFTTSLFKPYYKRLLKEPENEKWWLQWQIIHVSDNKLIGGILFKGRPNEKGEVEIGYGLKETYMNKGYMTEAVRTLIQWALTQPQVLAVTAETDKDNIASQRVVEKAGMTHCFETNNEIWWRIQNI